MTLTEAFDRVRLSPLGRYQSAVVRIAVAGSWLLFLLREWPHRAELYGPDGPMSFDMAQRRVAENDAFTVLLWSRGETWFELVYTLAMLASLALMLGWRTRAASVLFMIGVLSLQNRNSYVGDGGDNVFHLMAIYLVATRCGQVWSLDSRRSRLRGAGPDVAGVALWVLLAAGFVATLSFGLLSWGWALVFGGLLAVHAVWSLARRYAPGEPRGVCDQVANLVHNGALLVIVGQLCVLYASAGWYKIQGGRWQDGTAAYYPMQVEAFTPWPVLSDLVSSQAFPILLMTYGTVLVQVAFPFSLLNRRAKNVLLALLIAEHAGIAILLGLPFFSLAVIAADLIFLPTSLLLRVEEKVSRWRRRKWRRLAAEQNDPDPAAREPEPEREPART
ncbi:MAG: HTTM domain-containing protein [Thermocrispum sp.]